MAGNSSCAHVAALSDCGTRWTRWTRCSRRLGMPPTCCNTNARSIVGRKTVVGSPIVALSPLLHKLSPKRTRQQPGWRHLVLRRFRNPQTPVVPKRGKVNGGFVGDASGPLAAYISTRRRVNGIEDTHQSHVSKVMAILRLESGQVSMVLLADSQPLRSRFVSAPCSLVRCPRNCSAAPRRRICQQYESITGTVGTPEEVVEAYINCIKDSFATSGVAESNNGRLLIGGFKDEFKLNWVLSLTSASRHVIIQVE